MHEHGVSTCISAPLCERLSNTAAERFVWQASSATRDVLPRKAAAGPCMDVSTDRFYHYP